MPWLANDAGNFYPSWLATPTKRTFPSPFIRQHEHRGYSRGRRGNAREIRQFGRYKSCTVISKPVNVGRLMRLTKWAGTGSFCGVFGAKCACPLLGRQFWDWLLINSGPLRFPPSRFPATSWIRGQLCCRVLRIQLLFSSKIAGFRGFLLRQ